MRTRLFFYAWPFSSAVLTKLDAGVFVDMSPVHYDFDTTDWKHLSNEMRSILRPLLVDDRPS